MSPPIPLPFHTPDWVKHAVFYQIFPDRFANGDTASDPENVQPWGAPPTFNSFMGGDLQGIIDRLDYLADLGVNALYLNPIFLSSSNHKYHTDDYYRIDPRFGDMDAFRRLIDAAHARSMRVILDGVFNHAGRGFFAFTDILENEGASPYLKWFHVTGLPLHAYDGSKPANYEAWWGMRALPKFNTDHPPVRRYLLDVARYWIAQGADGWRLDVPNEIADHTFWQAFRDVVKEENPDAYIVGEIWNDASPWLDGTQFDAVMNYVFRDLCRDFFARDALRTDEFAAAIDALIQRYPREATLAQLNLFGSHDTARFRTEAGGDVRRMRPTTLFQMTFPGAPCIYYGDEVGLEGGGDPHCRGCFPWDERHWDHGLRDYIKRCVAIRNAHPALRTGEWRTLSARGNLRLYAYARWDARERLVVVLNARETTRTLDVPLHDVPISEHARLTDLLSGETYVARGGRIEGVTVPAWGGVVLHYDAI
ncbi:MAG: cyclomaltodextrinase C-terminal domain-containing protein [Chloroflexales bacterium]|nr:cyclomaltodextrinase C-terminal domain-containing protein [Chloroflexales bacterium]